MYLQFVAIKFIEFITHNHLLNLPKFIIVVVQLCLLPKIYAKYLTKRFVTLVKLLKIGQIIGSISEIVLNDFNLRIA